MKRTVGLLRFVPAVIGCLPCFTILGSCGERALGVVIPGDLRRVTLITTSTTNTPDAATIMAHIFTSADLVPG